MMADTGIADSSAPDSSTAGSGRVQIRHGLGWKGVVAVALLVLIGGLVFAGWLVSRFDLMPLSSQSSPSQQSSAQARPAAAPNPDISSILDSANTPAPNADVAAKVEELEKRVARIDQTGASDGPAIAFSSRSGGVATALRVRRAIDSGTSLELLEERLSERFGDQFPKAVDAIQKLANAPVTASELRDDLTRNSDAIIGRSSDTSLWDRIQLELGELFQLRQRGEPSASPAHILQIAQENIANGDVKSAVAKISKLPPNAASTAWLVSAGRLVNAKDAIDRIERAALAAPVASPVLVAPSDALPVPSVRPAREPAPQAAQDTLRR